MKLKIKYEVLELLRFDSHDKLLGDYETELEAVQLIRSLVEAQTEGEPREFYIRTIYYGDYNI